MKSFASYACKIHNYRSKIALSIDKTENSINVHRDMKLLPLHLRQQVHLSSYIFKITKGESPNNFINKFRLISEGNRDGANCNLYTHKSSNLKHFYYLDAKAWNNLPSSLRNKSDAKVFSKSYKTQSLDNLTHDQMYVVNNAFDYLYRPNIA